MTLALGLPGGEPQLVINDAAGLSSELLRETIAKAVGLDSTRVLVTSVQLQLLQANGTFESAGAEIVLNATVAANSGALVPNGTSFIWSLPSPTVPPLRRALQRAADEPSSAAVCVTYRAFNVTNVTRTYVHLALDLSDLAWVNSTDPALGVATRLAFALSYEYALRNVSYAWTQCTGGNASDGIAVLQPPAVRVGLRPSPSTPAAAVADGSGGGTQGEHGGLGNGGLTAVVVVVTFTTLACCCFVFALCGARRRRKERADDDAPSPAPAPSDLAVAAMLEVVVCGRGGAAAAASSVAAFK